MTDTRKGRHDDEIEDLDFGDFAADAPPGAPPGADFDFDMPDPHRSSGGAKPVAATPEDDFADLGGFGEPEPHEEPVAVRGRAPAPVAPPDDFGLDEIDEAPRSRVSLGKGPAQSPHVYDEGDEGDEPRVMSDAGFDPAAGFDAGDDARDGADEGDDAPGPDEGGRGRFDPSKYIVPAGGAVAALVVMFVGWSFVLSPMLGTDSAPVPQGPLTSIAQPAAAGGPRQFAGVPGASAIDTPLAPLPASPPQQPSASPFPAQPAPRVTAPTTPIALPSASPLPPSQITNQAQVPSATALARPDPGMEKRIQELEGRIEALQKQAASPELQQRVRELDARLASFESRSVPPAPRPEVQVPYKPQVIDGYTLQGVNRGVAWVQGPAGLIEVREGTDLGTAGKVMGVQKYNKDFIVVTSAGVIMRN